MTGLQRLAVLADWLETIPPERIEMGAWKCGTSACAVGWGCASPALAEEGLRFATRWGSVESPSYDGRSDWDAVEAFFDLTFDEADFLFFDYDDPSKSAVVARIREFIRSKEQTDATA